MALRFLATNLNGHHRVSYDWLRLKTWQRASWRESSTTQVDQSGLSVLQWVMAEYHPSLEQRTSLTPWNACSLAVSIRSRILHTRMRKETEAQRHGRALLAWLPEYNGLLQLVWNGQRRRKCSRAVTETSTCRPFKQRMPRLLTMQGMSSVISERH